MLGGFFCILRVNFSRFACQATTDSGTEIVIPDTCMDIMFGVDYSENKINSVFCGIQDKSFIAHSNEVSDKKIFCAAIRFYAWGISLFAEDSLKQTKNALCDADVLFSAIKREIEAVLFDISDMQQFIMYVELILLKHLNEKHRNEIVMQSVGDILVHKGNISICDLKSTAYVSDRQLERLFKEYIGVSPKQFASMIRYQYLWNDIVFRKECSSMDMVYKYGYTDQAHMLHDFRKYHGMSISDACKNAYDVGNLQDRIQRI